MNTSISAIQTLVWARINQRQVVDVDAGCSPRSIQNSPASRYRTRFLKSSAPVAVGQSGDRISSGGSRQPRDSLGHLDGLFLRQVFVLERIRAGIVDPCHGSPPPIGYRGHQPNS